MVEICEDELLEPDDAELEAGLELLEEGDAELELFVPEPCDAELLKLDEIETEEEEEGFELLDPAEFDEELEGAALFEVPNDELPEDTLFMVGEIELPEDEDTGPVEELLLCGREELEETELRADEEDIDDADCDDDTRGGEDDELLDPGENVFPAEDVVLVGGGNAELLAVGDVETLEVVLKTMESAVVGGVVSGVVETIDSEFIESE